MKFAMDGIRTEENRNGKSDNETKRWELSMSGMINPTTLEDESPQKFSFMWVIDGNNSLKRVDGLGTHKVADQRVFQGSDYFLSEEYVDTYKDEVKKPTVTVEDVEDEDNPDFEDDGSDPTDGAENDLSGCTKNWKAASADGNKKMWGGFRESGIFASACRHGFIMWLCDMVRSGEL